jgi:hypothetical protein
MFSYSKYARGLSAEVMIPCNFGTLVDTPRVASVQSVSCSSAAVLQIRGAAVVVPHLRDSAALSAAHRSLQWPVQRCPLRRPQLGATGQRTAQLGSQPVSTAQSASSPLVRLAFSPSEQH